MAEPKTNYRRIRRVQVRVRVNIDARPDVNALPSETDQYYVMLQGDNHRYMVRYRYSADNLMETALFSLLRDSFMHGKEVKIAYQEASPGATNRYITAVWAK